VGHVYEYAYLIRKKGYKEIYMGDFYGDPRCGLIDSNNNWSLVGGNILTVWTKDKGLIEIEDEELPCICGLRQKSAYEAEILIDPWSKQGSVWVFNIETFHRYKIREHRIDDEYSEEIGW
jgi:hypothetical protein